MSLCLRRSDTCRLQLLTVIVYLAVLQDYDFHGPCLAHVCSVLLLSISCFQLTDTHLSLFQDSRSWVRQDHMRSIRLPNSASH